MAPADPRGLADHRGPVVRRPGDVDARPPGGWLLGGGSDATDHRPDGVRRRHRRHLRRHRAPPSVDTAYEAGPDRAGGRPGVARRGAGPGRGDPGAPRRPGDRGGRPQHQSPRRPDAEQARDQLSPDCRRPDQDDRLGPLPRFRPAQRPRGLTAGGRRVPAGRRRRPGRLREPQRVVGLSQARPGGRPRRSPADRPHPRPGAAAEAARTRRPSARCSARGRTATPRSDRATSR